MLGLSNNCNSYLLTSQLPKTFSYPLNAGSQYQIYLFSVNFTPSQYIQLPTHAHSQYQLYLLHVIFTPSQHIQLPLNARSQFQLYLLPVT